MRIHLIRHMRVEGSEGLCYGRTEVPLAAGHERQTALVLQQLPRGPWRVWSSTSLRCRQLAASLAPMVRVDSRLCELDFGRWEGRLWSEIPRGEIDAWAQDPVRGCPPGGESFLELQARACAVLDELCSGAGAGAPVVCTHAGVIRALLAKAGGKTLEEALSIEVPFGSVHSVQWKGAVTDDDSTGACV